MGNIFDQAGVCDRIDKMMTKRNLSTKQIAELLNVSIQSVYKWRTGYSLPDYSNLILLSMLLDTTTDYLLLGK